jgi:hypothetical protein
MKKKIAAVVLVAVCAWLWWPEKEPPPPPMTVREACGLQSAHWCGSAGAVHHGEPYSVRCELDYYNRCVNGRDLSERSVSVEQHQRTVRVLDALYGR